MVGRAASCKGGSTSRPLPHRRREAGPPGSRLATCGEDCHWQLSTPGPQLPSVRVAVPEARATGHPTRRSDDWLLHRCRPQTKGFLQGWGQHTLSPPWAGSGNRTLRPKEAPSSMADSAEDACEVCLLIDCLPGCVPVHSSRPPICAPGLAPGPRWLPWPMLGM